MAGTRRLLFSVSIKDCRVDTFTVGGHGGTGKDTSNTGVRITHPPSGAVGTATDTRSQLSNKQLAFRRMGDSKLFQAWARAKAATLNSGKSIDDVVEEMMQPGKLLVEYRTADGWVEERK